MINPELKTKWLSTDSPTLNMYFQGLVIASGTHPNPLRC